MMHACAVSIIKGVTLYVFQERSLLGERMGSFIARAGSLVARRRMLWI